MLSKIQKELIEDELRKTGGNLSRAARVLGVDYNAIMTEYTGSVIKTRTVKTPKGDIPEDFRSLGRERLQRFVVAVKKDGLPGWPDRFTEAIRDARRKYDEGTHEMCQGLNPDGWVILYLIPRQKKVSKRHYFGSMEEC